MSLKAKIRRDFQHLRKNRALKSNHAIFAILCLLCFPLMAEEPVVPDLDTNVATPIEQKPIVKQETVEGEEEVWAVDTTTRREYIYPSIWGTAGIFRVRSAESLPDGALTFGIGGEFYSVPNPLGYGNANTIAESLFIGYAPTDRLTLAVMRHNSSTTFGEPQQLISSLGDFNFTATYAIPVTKMLVLAPIVNFLVASNFNDLAPAGTTVSVGGGIAGTLSFWQALNIPLFLHANLLYHMPQIRTSKASLVAEPEAFFNFSRFHTVTAGLGAEFKLGDVMPFLEFWQTAQTDSSLNWANSPSKVSVGARFTPLSNKSLAVLLGADIGLVSGKSNNTIVPGVPFNPSYQILGQLSYTFGVTQTERKHYYTTHDVNVVDRKFVIKKNIRFKVGKADLENESFALLDQIADVIKQNNVKKLLIVGHTDSTHTDQYNLKLSQDRANTVKRYIASRGIPEDTLIAQGYGKRKPKASNATEQGRALNRRVEFYILE